MKPGLLVMFTVAAFVLLVSSGCYTVLRHPAGSRIVSDSVYEDVTYSPGTGGSCVGCHASVVDYHPSYRYGESHYRWNNYYGDPWWQYDDWWWGEQDYPDGGVDGGPGVEQGTRHLWGGSGWATKGWGGSPPSPPQRARSTEPKPDDAESTDDAKKDDGTPDLWRNRKKGF